MIAASDIGCGFVRHKPELAVAVAPTRPDRIPGQSDANRQRLAALRRYDDSLWIAYELC
jgi:hypothetical protein